MAIAVEVVNNENSRVRIDSLLMSEIVMIVC